MAQSTILRQLLAQLEADKLLERVEIERGRDHVTELFELRPIEPRVHSSFLGHQGMSPPSASSVPLLLNPLADRGDRDALVEERGVPVLRIAIMV